MLITVQRLSDGSTYRIEDVDPDSYVTSVIILKPAHRLKHYGIEDNATIQMDDRENWSSTKKFFYENYFFYFI
ncbi:unnamed protein product [Brachionus calyciflorus]|uniref:Uncharacterized protein n=1 Tax=Brachionus calyciflorus TaxID=104777 RepID=A0A813QRV7_9BILA|nr:unnamed protein product [Brachionus calyciflorus]